jgi:hypothetical protein
VILAAQQLHTAATLLDAAESIRTQGIALAYGGLIFNVIPELRTRIPGNFLGGGVAQAPEGVEALMIAPHPASPVEAVSEAYRRARDHFSEREGLIESQVVQALIPSGTAAGLLSMVNRRMGLSIDAALALGDIRFLGTVIEWRRGLIRYEQIPDEALRRYLDTYYQVARDQLDERGEPIISWLDTMVNGY